MLTAVLLEPCLEALLSCQSLTQAWTPQHWHLNLAMPVQLALYQMLGQRLQQCCWSHVLRRYHARRWPRPKHLGIGTLILPCLFSRQRISCWVDACGSAVGAMAWVVVPVVDPGLNISFTRDCVTMTLKAWGSQKSGPNHPVKAAGTIALYHGAAINRDSNIQSVLLEPLLCTMGWPWIRTQTVLQCC